MRPAEIPKPPGLLPPNRGSPANTAPRQIPPRPRDSPARQTAGCTKTPPSSRPPHAAETVPYPTRFDSRCCVRTPCHEGKQAPEDQQNLRGIIGRPPRHPHSQTNQAKPRESPARTAPRPEDIFAAAASISSMAGPFANTPIGRSTRPAPTTPARFPVHDQALS